MLTATATIAALPFGGEFIKQILSQGPVVIILCAIIFFGTKYVRSVTLPAIEKFDKFQAALDARFYKLEQRINKLLKKEGIDFDE